MALQKAGGRPGGDDKPARRRCASAWPQKRRVDPLERVYEQRSSDGQTVKWLFRLHDGLTIETVLMLYDDVSGSTRERRTVCISTQAGCAMGCVFCATGQAGLARNLTAGEIVAQVLAAARWLADGKWQIANGELQTLALRCAPAQVQV